MAGSGFSERRDMEALNAALERYERLLARGTSADVAAREASKLLTPGAAPLFVIADAVRVTARPLRTPSFADRMEAELRAAHGRVRELAPRSTIQAAARRRRSAGAMIMAFAACVAVLAGVLVGSSRSLPGDDLYGIKRASEGAELAVVWGPTEAHVRLSLAETRLNEVQGLFGRAGTHVIGAPGSNVASALDDMDPRIAQLIRETLADAEQQITVAAKILITEHSDSKALGRLATVAKQGASIAKGVAAALPSDDRPPVLTTSDNLAMVAVKAATVQQQVKQQQAAPATATLPPCPTPTPTPTPTATPSATPSSTPNSTPSASPSATPAATPTPQPCATPTPTPTPKPTPSATPEPASPKASPQSGNSAQGSPAAQPDQAGDGSGAQAGSADQSSDSTGVQPAS